MEARNLICFSCANFKESLGGCVAFPEGIPDEITSGKNKHKKKLTSQENDVVFEKIKE